MVSPTSVATDLAKSLWRPECTVDTCVADVVAKPSKRLWFRQLAAAGPVINLVVDRSVRRTQFAGVVTAVVAANIKPECVRSLLIWYPNKHSAGSTATPSATERDSVGAPAGEEG